MVINPMMNSDSQKPIVRHLVHDGGMSINHILAIYHLLSMTHIYLSIGKQVLNIVVFKSEGEWSKMGA